PPPPPLSVKERETKMSGQNLRSGGCHGRQSSARARTTVVPCKCDVFCAAKNSRADFDMEVKICT
ncbi:MAG: hypothetical protein ACTTI3_01460, partial [Treponema sp.]